MKTSIIIISLLSISLYTNGQTLDEINRTRINRTKNGMIILGSWASANIIASPIFSQQASGSEKYFYDMNLYWNIFNLAIAGFGYYNATQEDFSSFSISESVQAQNRIEKLLLFNAGLDFAYILGGLYLAEKGANRNDNKIQGFGRSIILQGSFLLIFDMIFYFSHHKGSSNLNKILNNLSLQANGIGWRVGFNEIR